MSFPVYTIITHVASQVFYRWLPPPILDELDKEQAASLDPMNMTLSDWHDLLRDPHFFGATRASEPWVRMLRAGESEGLQAIARAAVDHLQRCRSEGACMVPVDSPSYPERLRSIPDPPLALTVLGDPSLLKRMEVAVIGSRKASRRALTESFDLGRLLATEGIGVVSGGAYGCDIAAHQGTLTGTSPDILAMVVFAGGLGNLYPRGNEAIFARLRARGGILASERLWSSPSRPFDFPVRNRIVSGLSETVMIMQAEERSGAMVTARLAATQGRDVAVLTHEPGDVRATGGARLIAEGAIPFGSARECLDALVSPRAEGPLDKY